MANEAKLVSPWLVAVWPGMGQVAISAGYYLVAKLGAHLLAEFSPHDLFEAEYVEIKSGLIQPGRLPRSRVFAWRDPKQKRDLLFFLGEAQPPAGKLAFCRRLIELTRELGVERVLTFAAMATQMRPEQPSRVFGAATDEEILSELKRLELDVLEDGNIGGLNGVLLGVAAESGLRGACLLGEMPHIFAQLPFPQASLAVLEAFTTLANIEVDLTELSEQAKEVQQQLGELLGRLERAVEEEVQPEEEPFSVEPAEERGLSLQDERRIEQLFEQAGRDRSKAYALKQELDRLGVFRDYEDRFLDLFQKPE